jgi:hypothetical protein
VPEGLEPALACHKLDVVGLGARQEISDSRPERTRAPIHGPLADLVGRQAFVEDVDVLIRELDLHARLS